MGEGGRVGVEGVVLARKTQEGVGPGHVELGQGEHLVRDQGEHHHRGRHVVVHGEREAVQPQHVGQQHVESAGVGVGALGLDDEPVLVQRQGLVAHAAHAAHEAR